MDGVDTVGLGDHPALDFLNTIATPVRDPVESLTGGAAYLAWLERAGLIDTADRAEIGTRFTRADLDTAAAQAIALREWLRPLISTWAAHPTPSSAPTPTAPDSPSVTITPQNTPAPSDSFFSMKACDHLNNILAADQRFPRVEPGPNGRPIIAERRSWRSPAQLLVPPAEAAARLLTTGDPALVRPCEGPTCTLWFYDRTRSHRRRWCSMATCGNRAKARNHRQREHQGDRHA